MTYYDRLNVVYRRFEREPPPASAQLVMLYLLHINNCAGNKGQFHCTDVRLSNLTRLSKDTITQAKRYLKNKGYLDFKSDKKNPRKGTLYILPENVIQDAHQKTCKEQIKVSKTPEEKIPTTTPNTDSSVISEEVRHAWIAYASEEPDLGTRYKLNEFEKLYDVSTVVKAIKETKFYKGYITLYQVQEQIKKILAKGSEKNDARRNNGGIVRNTSTNGAGQDDDFSDDAFKQFYDLDS